MTHLNQQHSISLVPAGHRYEAVQPWTKQMHTATGGAVFATDYVRGSVPRVPNTNTMEIDMGNTRNQKRSRRSIAPAVALPQLDEPVAPLGHGVAVHLQLGGDVDAALASAHASTIFDRMASTYADLTRRAHRAGVARSFSVTTNSVLGRPS
ncbi:hypothetical protein [Nonomuraea jabiensis]|uniref:hypothetical protein n=1 Tax=Nonomuraea jabiensis TaxID=882448 RepID=UPI003D73CBF7